LPKFAFLDPQIDMAHGAGGKATRRLIDDLLGPLLYGTDAPLLPDSARLEIAGSQVLATSDSFVVKPLRFPGGSIGSLAVHGTVNDLAVSGARAQALLVNLVLEAGTETAVLAAELESLSEAARAAGVKIVGGDTKVVEKGKADRMYISTFGIGVPIPGLDPSPYRVRPGDRVLISGPVGDHGITILLARGDLDFEADLCSDSRSVLPLVEALAFVEVGVRWMRDPTRGGVATALNELAGDTGLGIVLRDDDIPLRDAVRSACELLGLDPLHIASEGQFLAVIAAEHAEAALGVLRRTPGGADSRIIGEVREQPSGTVLVANSYGSSRVVDMLVGDPLPRIC